MLLNASVPSSFHVSNGQAGPYSIPYSLSDLTEHNRCILCHAHPKYSGQILSSPSITFNTFLTVLTIQGIAVDSDLINHSWIAVVNNKHVFEATICYSFCPIPRKYGTHIKLTFFFEAVDPIQMPIVFTISRTFILQSSRFDFYLFNGITASLLFSIHKSWLAMMIVTCLLMDRMSSNFHSKRETWLGTWLWKLLNN